MSDVMEISERGRQALRKPDGLRAELLLYLEVLARIGGSGDDSDVNRWTASFPIPHGSSIEPRGKA